MKNEHFKFLDNLRASGKTNMFGAAPYLQAAYHNMTYAEAKTIVAEWMRSYAGERKESDK